MMWSISFLVWWSRDNQLHLWIFSWRNHDPRMVRLWLPQKDNRCSLLLFAAPKPNGPTTPLPQWSSVPDSAFISPTTTLADHAVEQLVLLQTTDYRSYLLTASPDTSIGAYATKIVRFPCRWAVCPCKILSEIGWHDNKAQSDIKLPKYLKWLTCSTCFNLLFFLRNWNWLLWTLVSRDRKTNWPPMYLVIQW